MLKNYLKQLQKKMIKTSLIYSIFILFGAYISAKEQNIFAYGVAALFITFYISSIYRYISYYLWVKKQCSDGIAIIVFKSQPGLFFRNFGNFKLPLKEFAMPLRKQINYTVLNSLNVKSGTLFETEEGFYDFTISITNDVTTTYLGGQ